MSDEPDDTPVKKKKSWLGRLFKLTLFLAIFAVIIFTVLSKIGGNEPHHQQIIEQYASEISGYSARVQKFNSLNFFPLIIIDFERMEFRESAAAEVDALFNTTFTDPVMYLEKAYIVSSFWDVVFGTGKFRILDLSNIYIIPGIFLEDDIVFNTISIIENEDGTAHLQANGKIAETPFEIRKPVKTFGKAPKKTYRIIAAAPLEMTIGDAYASITFDTVPGDDNTPPVTTISGTIRSDTLNAQTLDPNGRLSKNLNRFWTRTNNPDHPVRRVCDLILKRSNGAQDQSLSCDDEILKINRLATP